MSHLIGIPTEWGVWNKYACALKILQAKLSPQGNLYGCHRLHSLEDSFSHIIKVNRLTRPE